MMHCPKYNRPFIDFENPAQCEDAVVTRFLNNIIRGTDWRINVINHFHSSIENRQVTHMLEYFHSFLGNCSLHSMTHTKNQMFRFDHFYHKRCGKSMIDHVRIGIRFDDVCNENRIASMHVMDRHYKLRRKAIFTIPRK
jgi:hypothetical protein